MPRTRSQTNGGARSEVAALGNDLVDDRAPLGHGQRSCVLVSGTATIAVTCLCNYMCPGQTLFCSVWFGPNVLRFSCRQGARENCQNAHDLARRRRSAASAG